ncbi:MAG: hypothetical protein COT15_01640 [Candidatus Diapherotrites archaeon CG08_land_8_20_14_0_20_34_12]|nr:MAG: hypothetical protein COT15_01640 [Candidatus Diapherotrites archaeon CG08_land_8_20_14_0_20_34_12]
MINYLIDLFFVGFPLWFKAAELKIKKPLNKRKILKIFNELGLSKISSIELIKKTLILLVTLFIALIIISILSSYFGLNDSELIKDKIQSISSQSTLILAYLLIIRVICEEIFFRGFLLGKLGNFFQAFLFAILHFSYESQIEVIGAFILGLILGKAAKDNKNLFPNILAHLIYNAIVVTLMGIL